jgi:Xaa-Pro aminopeptidase
LQFCSFSWEISANFAIAFRALELGSEAREEKVKELGPQRFVQAIAREVLAALPATITADDTEVTIASRAVEMMQDRGVQDTWYHQCPALVLLGTRSCLSVSGRDYVPADEPVGSFNLITVDLSPALDGVWGDCARSFYVENGRCVDPPSLPEFARGARAEQELHETLVRCAHPALTFHELFQIGNQEIARLGFENLDFRGNLGHTIEKELSARRYIESGSSMLLGDAAFFTFEPHIREPGSAWGFKHENIYYFDKRGMLTGL